ncbi:MAG: hypothetical protein U0840_20270 [Gemmataceae bacterium]
MSGRILIPVGVLTLALLGPALSPAQDGKAKDPESKYAMDLRARKSTEPEFTKDTRKYGVEIYTDGPTGDGIHLSEVGAISVVPSKLFKAGDGKAKEPLWQHGLTLNVRPAGEKSWEKGKKFGLEVFKDDTNGDLIYLSEAGILGTVPAKYATATTLDKGKPKNPAWKHAMDLKVRKAGESDWDKARKLGVEVFRDENNDNLLYLTETGHFAVVPGKLTAKEETGKGPTWQHGLELAARKQGEKEFTKDTKKYGLEVFLDENNGNQIYLAETGAIAVVPAKFAKPTEGGKAKDPQLKHAMDLQVRKAGQKDFTKEAPRFGVEVYLDENNGNLLYLGETGELSVVSPRAE